MFEYILSISVSLPLVFSLVGIVIVGVKYWDVSMSRKSEDGS